MPKATTGPKSFAQDALVLMGNRFAVMAISMLTGVVLARCLGASGRGVIAAVTVYPGMFLSLAEMGVRQSTTYYLGRQIFSNSQVISAASALMVLAGSVGVLLCVAFLRWTGNPEFTPTIIALAVGTIPLAILTSYSSGILLGNRLVGQFAKLSRMVEVQRLLAVLLFVWLLGWGASGALLATLLSGLAVAGFAFWRIAQLAPIRPVFDWPIIRALLLKGVVYAVSLFVITLNYKVSVVLLERLSTSEQLGQYTIGVGIATLTWALPQAITTALFSHSATAKDESAFSRKVARLFRVTLVIALLLVLAIAVSAPLLVPQVYGAEFRPSVRVLLYMLPGVFCLLALKVLNMDLAGRGHPNKSLWIMLPALIGNCLLGIWLIPAHGSIGAAVASTISYIFAGIGMTFLYCQVTRMPLGELLSFQQADFALFHSNRFIARFRR